MEQATRPKDSHVPIVADMKIKEHIPKHFEKKKTLAIELPRTGESWGKHKKVAAALFSELFSSFFFLFLS